MMTLFNYENILKNNILEEREDARTEGIAIGETKGRNSTFFELVKDGVQSPKDAAGRVNLSESAFVEQMNSYFKRVQATT